jgi:bifunctional DNase/RNase
VVDENRFDDEEQPEPDDMFGKGFPLFGGEEGPSEDREEFFERKLDEKEVKVTGLYESKHGTYDAQAILVCVKDNYERSVFIEIGFFEARAISLALQGTLTDRPMTHDLLKNLVGRMGGSIDRIVIDDLMNQTFYAKIIVQMDGKIIDIDSRPSDAIALALRVKAPIYMAESVLEQAAVHEEY